MMRRRRAVTASEDHARFRPNDLALYGRSYFIDLVGITNIADPKNHSKFFDFGGSAGV